MQASEWLTLERIARLSWPAADEYTLQTGWHCRANGGYSKRANSAWVEVANEQEWSGVVAATEAWYASRQQPSLIKVTGWQPTSLDTYLADAGYQVLDPSSVMVRPLSEAIITDRGDVEIVVGGTEVGWQQVYQQLSGLPTELVSPFLAQLSLMPERVSVTVSVHGQPVATGLGLLLDGYLGLCDIVTHPAHRQRGFAERVVRQLMSEGVARGCHTAWLQVFDSNTAAHRLYGRVGFHRAYGYHYRMKPLVA